MGRNRPSNEDAPRVPGEEGSGRGRPIIWVVLGLILLLLLALLIPFACQALRGAGDQGSGNGGPGAQAGGSQEEEGQGGKPEDKRDSAQGGGTGGGSDDRAGRSGDAQGNTGAESTGAGDSRDEVDADLASVPDRSGDGTLVTIPKAKLEGTKGWLAVHADDDGEPGAVLGHAALGEGSHTGVRVKLDRPIDSSQRLYAMVHAEDPADGEYTFPDGDPPITGNGKMAVEPISYTVSDAASGGAADSTSGEQAGSIRGGDLPESGGVPSAVLLAAGVTLLLLSVASLSLALRQGGANGN